MLAADDGEQLRVLLLDWLRRERIPGVTVVPEWAEIPAGHMGAVSDALLVTLSPAAASAFAGTLAVWLRMRRTEVRLTIRRGEQEVTLDAKALRDPELVIREILKTSETD